MLTEKGIENAIFHWYSGSLNVLRNIVNSGFFFSINSAMIQSDNGKKIIAEIPKELILTETDFPYIDNSNIVDIHMYLSNLWNISIENVEQIIASNLNKIIQRIRLKTNIEYD
jgi:TatD DNase family protein